jgi:transcriptional regulator with XRE-family HTH domain
MPATDRAPFGRMLRDWRRSRGLSQLDLAVNCGVSQRHLSFLETGRANPSRGMVLHLAGALAIPLRQQNALLLAAGFAPAYGERALESPEMSEIDRALDRAISQQEPFPALVVDRDYNLLRANTAAQLLMAFLTDLRPAPDAPPPELNILALLLDPAGVRPHVANWRHVATWLLRRHRAEILLEETPPALEAALAPFLAFPGVAELLDPQREEEPLPPTLIVEYAKDGLRLKLFSMIATMGTPLDATLQDLRVEFFFPADAPTERWFRAGAGEAA